MGRADYKIIEVIFFTKIGVKSTVLKVQRIFKYKSVCTINFVKNEAIKMECPPHTALPIYRHYTVLFVYYLHRHYIVLCLVSIKTLYIYVCVVSI